MRAGLLDEFKFNPLIKIMKKIIISGALCSLLMLSGAPAAHATEAVTTSATLTQADMLQKIQELMKLIADLQTKLNEAKGQVKELATTLGIGSRGTEVEDAQEILATDPSIFPVKPTGYFGPITAEGIKKFQERFGLPVTGVLDDATREAMKQLRADHKDGKLPPGLIKSKEEHDKIKARLQEKWGDCIWGEKFRASDCAKGHDEKANKDENDDEDATDDGETDDDCVAGASDSSSDCMKEHGDMKRHASSSREFSGNVVTGATSTRERGDMKHGTSTGAALATKTVAAAKVALNKFAADVATMKAASTTTNSSNKQLKKAEKKLMEAKKKLADAEMKLTEMKYKAAIEKARQVLKIVVKQEVKKTTKSQ